MNNDRLLLGNELALFMTKIANLDTLKFSNHEPQKMVLEEDEFSRKVSYVTFFESYGRNAVNKHKTFYVLEGSGCYTLNEDCVRYVAGDVLMAVPNSKWNLESDKTGTKLIEVCSIAWDNGKYPNTEDKNHHLESQMM